MENKNKTTSVPNLHQLKALVAWRRTGDNYMDLTGSKDAVNQIKTALQSIERKDPEVVLSTLPVIANCLPYLELWSDRFPADRFYNTLYISYLNAYSNLLMADPMVLFNLLGKPCHDAIKRFKKALGYDDLDDEAFKMKCRFFMFKLSYFIPFLDHERDPEKFRTRLSHCLRRMLRRFDVVKKVELFNFGSIYLALLSEGYKSKHLLSSIVKRLRTVLQALKTVIIYHAKKANGMKLSSTRRKLLDPKAAAIEVACLTLVNDKVVKPNKDNISKMGYKTKPTKSIKRFIDKTPNPVQYSGRKPMKQYEYEGYKPRSVKEVVVKVKKRRTLTKPLGLNQ